MKRVVRNPYAAVDWANVRQFKAQLHAHTTNSDGARPPAEVVDLFRQWGYDILAITDHDYDIETTDQAGRHPDQKTPTWPWTSFDRDPIKLGMLAVKGLEPSNTDHFVQLHADFWTEDDLNVETDPGDPESTLYRMHRKDLDWMIGTVGERDGIADIAHPGRNDRSTEFYLQRFIDFTHVVGIDAYNRDNRYPGDPEAEPPVPSDLERWDNILTEARTQGRDLPIWGWSVDDYHIPALDLSTCYQTHLMAELTVEAFRASAESGAFFSTWDTHALGDPTRHVHFGVRGWTAAPIFDRVTVGLTEIRVEVRQAETVQWISDGELVATGTSLPLDTAGLGGYARAQAVAADGAITHTQPFYLEDGGELVAVSGKTAKPYSRFLLSRGSD